jgi:hypothetical protein
MRVSPAGHHCFAVSQAGLLVDIQRCFEKLTGGDLQGGGHEAPSQCHRGPYPWGKNATG